MLEGWSGRIEKPAAGLAVMAASGSPDQLRSFDVKLITAAEVRAEIARLPAEYRDSALQLMGNAWDDGYGVAVAGLPRKNPFMPPEAPPRTKGKR